LSVGRGLRPAAILLVVSAAASWAAVAAVRHGMGAMSGTMGLSVIAFVGLWALMMAAMMLPGVTPFASFDTRTFVERREQRVLAFASGYLLVWAAMGLPAFGLAWITDRLATDHVNAATALAVLVFLSCGVYQLTPLKNRCLALCRPPLGFTLRYATFDGRGRDLRAGILHGAFCAGCCWTLMLLLFAFGLMNVFAMVAVATAVFMEKTWRHGVGFARVVGVMSIVFAALVMAHPGIAPGLHSSNATMIQGTM
jgi:predicted metal-binding membrane protein